MASSQQPDVFKNTARRAKVVFVAVVCGTLLAVAASRLPLGNERLNIALVLAAAGVNAFLVAGYLMHLLSERWMIYTVLGFTVFFAAGLLGLTVWAAGDVPAVVNR